MPTCDKHKFLNRTDSRYVLRARGQNETKTMKETERNERNRERQEHQERQERQEGQEAQARTRPYRGLIILAPGGSLALSILTWLTVTWNPWRPLNLRLKGFYISDL